MRLRAVHVPGHTDDSCMFVYEPGNVAFVGDTVYQGGPGLTVFPTGNPQKLEKSIRDSILTLPDDMQLCSGHAGPVTVEEFREALR